MGINKLEMPSFHMWQQAYSSYHDIQRLNGKCIQGYALCARLEDVRVLLNVSWVAGVPWVLLSLRAFERASWPASYVFRTHTNRITTHCSRARAVSKRIWTMDVGICPGYCDIERFPRACPFYALGNAGAGKSAVHCMITI
jgi:hypothetical protein